MPPKKRTSSATKKGEEPPPAEAPKAKKQKKEAVEEEPQLRPRRSSSSGVTEESILQGTIPFVRKTKPADFDSGSMLKVISWNVAGLRAVLKNSTELQDLLKAESPDVLCIQEVKVADLEEANGLGVYPGYKFTDSVCTVKKGYSGVRTYVKDGVRFEINAKGLEGTGPDPEGRVLTTVLPQWKLDIVNSYVPNSGMMLDRLEYRTETFDRQMRSFLQSFDASRLVWCGDLNVAERDYDRFFNNWNAMQKCPGFTPEERASFRVTLAERGLIDGFRACYPNSAGLGTYTFFSKRQNQRAQGHGWRLDYFVLGAALASRLVDVFPLPEYEQSDHLPLVMWLKKQ